MSIDNYVSIKGNLTQNAEFKQGSEKAKLTELRIAVNESYKNQETGEYESRANYINVEVWGNRSETCRDYQTGDAMHVVGRLRQKTWKDKDTGKTRDRIVIVADEVQNLSRFLKVKTTQVQIEPAEA